MPLDAEAEAVAVVFDAFDDAVGSSGVDDGVEAGGSDGLVVGGVHVHRGGADDAVEEGSGDDIDAVAGFVARVGLFVGQRVRDAVGDMLDQGAAKGDGEELLAATDAEDGDVAGKGAFDQSEFGLGAAGLEGHGFVHAAVAVEGGINVEGAAGDDEGVEPVEVVGGEFGVVWQGDGEAAGGGDGAGVVGAQRVPGVFGPAARLFAVERDADDGFLHEGVASEVAGSEQATALGAAMAMALDAARAAAARGEVPVGAVVLGPGGEVLAAAGNRTEELCDATAHAEVLALRAAAARVGSARLAGCTLVVTLEPCAMCAAAAGLFRVGRVVFGAYDPKGGGVEHGARVFATQGALFRPEVIGGLRESEAAAMLRDFFSLRR